MKRPSVSGVITVLLRILLVLMIIAALMVGVLKLLERSGDPLRQGIEKYIADTTGHHVYLKELPDPKFFPDVSLTMKNIIISDNKNPTLRRGTIESIHFSTPYLSTVIGRPSFKALDMRDLKIEEGMLFPRPLTIRHAAIDSTGAAPLLRAEGALGKTPLTVTIGLTRRGAAPPTYTLSPPAPLNFVMGRVTVTGSLVGTKDGMRLVEAVMKDEKGADYGPQDFFVLKNQEFVKDNPISCLLAQEADSKLTDAHPCATLFDRKDTEEPTE